MGQSENVVFMGPKQCILFQVFSMSERSLRLTFVYGQKLFGLYNFHQPLLFLVNVQQARISRWSCGATRLLKGNTKRGTDIRHQTNKQTHRGVYRVAPQLKIY